MAITSVIDSSIALARIYPPEASAVGMANTSKQSVIAALVRRLVTLGGIPSREEYGLIKAIMARESLGTTALGNGVAFPHVRTHLAERLLGVLGLERGGIAFDALDGSPVYGVFLLVAPEDVTKEYFEVLGRITAIGKDKTLRLQLRGCRSAEAVQRFLQGMDGD